ncbi:MAG: hypothetical protein OXD01_07280, partial [Gammaproteobacteria bacterium]|nr:hypothetical protein [Gammaproteobacteria bacterium]
TSDEATVQPARDGFPEPMEPEPEPTGQRYVLTPTIDDIDGTDLDDTIVAQPVQGSNNLFQATLNSFDSIDGGGGTDTIHIFGVDPGEPLRLGAEDVTNVENVVINTVGGIDANLTDWEGLESVTLERFGRADETTVDITVDGATVSTDRTFDGDVTIVGADGTVDIEAGSSSMVHVGSAGHTESVIVKGGESVRVDNGAGRHSTTVTTVSVDGVEESGVGDPTSTTTYSLNKSGDFVVNESGVQQVGIQISGVANGDDTPRVDAADITLGTARDGKIPLLGPDNSVGTNDDGEARDPITVVPATGADPVALVFNTMTGKIELENGRAIPSNVTIEYTNKQQPGVTSTTTMTPTAGTDATVNVHSNEIQTVHLHNTNAIAIVNNGSKMADGKAMPEDLALTVNQYGSHRSLGDAATMEGTLYLGGKGSADDITITVAGDSAFTLASGAVKTLDISGEGRLRLGVNNYKEDSDPSDDGVSKTLKSIAVSGDTGVVMPSLAGMSALETIDASASSGNNHFRSQAGMTSVPGDELDALTMVKGGSGNDIVTLRTSVTGKLESIHTGDGKDKVTVTGAPRSQGLMVELGAGDDSYFGKESNEKSRIDGGEGTDTLNLFSTADSTYREDGKTKSIYTGFETLDLAGSRGDFDIKQLGIENDVLVTASTEMGSMVNLKNMADGMGIHVHGVQGNRRTTNSTDTEAKITHELANDASRGSRELNLHLLAKGSRDTKDEQSGVAELTLTISGTDIEVVNIDSMADPHSANTTPAINRAQAKHYVNKLILTSGSVEDVNVSGNAQLVIEAASGSPLGDLEEVDARRNSGGVTFDGSSLPASQPLELIGGSGDDKFTGGAGNDEINGNDGKDTLDGGVGNDELYGGAGEDILIGGAGQDSFIIGAVSDSQLSFNVISRNPEGMDTIGEFNLDGTINTASEFSPTDDSIVLPRALHASFQGRIKQTGDNAVNIPSGDTYWIIDANDEDVNHDDDDDTPMIDDSPDTIQAFVRANGNGFFETRTAPGAGNFGSGTVNQHSIAVVHEDAGTSTDDDDGIDYTWIFIDVDNDGDLDLSTDHVIRLVGNIGITTADFVTD